MYTNAQAYNFNYLSLQEGLPQSQAHTILFDNEMHAWIGTQGGGMCRFDGEDFEYFTKNDSLISNRVYALSEINGEIWAGQKGGVSVFEVNGDFNRNYRLERSDIIVRDFVKWEEQLYLATNNGVYYLQDGKFTPYQENPSIKQCNAFQFFKPENKGIWVCTTKGVLNLNDPYGKLNEARGLSVSHVESATMFNGNWVLGTYGGGVQFYDGKVYVPQGLKELNDLIILSLYNLGDRELWIGTLNNGVYMYDNEMKQLKNFKSINGLSGNHIRTIGADHWENIWIGTSGGGVSIYQNSPFIEYNSSSGLNGDYVFAVLKDSRENLWLGTEGMGVLRINDTSKVLFDEELGFYREKVKAIFEDKRGNVWIGTEGKGLGVYDPRMGKDTVFMIKESQGFLGKWVKSFAEDRKGNKVFVATNDGGIYATVLNRKAPDQFQFKRILSPKDINDRVRSINFYQDRLWFVADNGTYGYLTDKEKLIYKEVGKSFRNIAINESRVWLGSTDNGIMLFDIDRDTLLNKRWVTSASTKIESNNIYQLMCYNKELWVGTERGLDRIQLDSLSNMSRTEHFGYEEGFEGVETNINANARDKDGGLWFGTVDGLFVYKGTKTNPARRQPPKLKLVDVQIGFQSIEETKYADYFDQGYLDSIPTLSYDENYISFVFKAIHFGYASDIVYRWKLDGVDKDWVPTTKISTATYPNLDPGNYTFQVQSSIDDSWEGEVVQFQFAINQPYWEQFWFKFSYYSFSVLIVLLIIFFLFRRQRNKSKALNEKLKMEKELLELEQKALRLQMNPHFIFNVLNSIHNLIILNNSDKARYALSKFSKLMRQVLENSREKFISIDDEIETLENYVQLERLTSNLEVDLTFDVNENIDSTEEFLPPLMIQPFVENSIIHGLKSVEGQGKIHISFKWCAEEVLECKIMDNGIGRKKASEIVAQKDAYHKSTALKVTQERLSSLNKETDFVPFEIVDLKKPNSEPEGTLVIIRLKV